MENMVSNLLLYSMDSITLGIFYWTPTAIMLVFYTFKNYNDIKVDNIEVIKYNNKLKEWSESNQSDDESRKPRYFRTHLTLGTIFGRYFISFVPLVNLFLTIFDAMSDIIDVIVNWFKKVFNINIVEIPK